MSAYWYLQNKDNNTIVHVGQSPLTTDTKPTNVYDYKYIRDFMGDGVNFTLINEHQAFELECEDLTPD